MPLHKQARTLNSNQVKLVLKFLETKRNTVRNKVIFLLSVKAGLRAMEIAHLKWDMLLTSNGAVDHKIQLPNRAAKLNSGRVIPLNSVLREHLCFLFEQDGLHRSPGGEFVVRTERNRCTTPQVLVNMFQSWYTQLGFSGCSSHSGRRTFITNAARKISTVGGSIRDVQILAGHSSLKTTERYIDRSDGAQTKVVNLI